jgi:predicted DNA-binding transcriptional regulator YafY
MDQAKRAPWGQERRLEFIDFRLYWEGRVNRSDLVNFFGVSVPQASLDLAKYQELAPQNAIYDRTEKAYVASEVFKPIIAASSAHAYLNQVLGLELGILQPNSSFLGSPPSASAVSDPSRSVIPSTLRAVLQAIRSRRTLEIKYQSMSRPLPTARTISPHAIAFDGFRWHIRAFCHERRDFLDFLFARVLEIVPGDSSPIDPSTDLVWQREVEVIILPHPALTEGQRRAIELDYGMDGGQLVLKAREALLWYLLKHLGLLREPNDGVSSDQVVLANRDDLKPFFASHGLGDDHGSA